MNVFTKAFFVKAVEVSVVTGASAFTGIVSIQGSPSVHSLIAGSVAFGLSFLYSLIKQYSVVQAVKDGVVGEPRHSIQQR
jgi:hypothetical protein